MRVLAALFLIVALAVSQLLAASSETLIVPGVRMGPFILGQTTEQEVLAKRGNPDQVTRFNFVDHFGGIMRFEYGSGRAETEFRFNPFGLLSSMITTDPAMKTALGLGAGSTAGEIRAVSAYGLLQVEEMEGMISFTFPFSGIAFVVVVANDGPASSVTIFKPR